MNALLPDPLHPAIVHFPIVFAVIAAPVLVGLAWAVASGRAPARAWALAVAMQALVALSAWAALETGEAQEERVEKVVAERYVEAHAERAETFLGVAAGLVVVAGVGLARGRVGALARGLAAAGAVAAVGLVAAVGHSGGELVYRHGAARAYLEPAGPYPAAAPAPPSPEAADDD